jgi:hypothetical protein
MMTAPSEGWTGGASKRSRRKDEPESGREEKCQPKGSSPSKTLGYTLWPTAERFSSTPFIMH